MKNQNGQTIDQQNKFKKMIKAVKLYIQGPNGELIRYFINVAGAIAVDYALFFIMDHFLHINYNIANVLSVVLATVYVYIASKFFVFRKPSYSFIEFFTELIKFIGSRTATILFEVASVWFLVSVIGMNSLLGKAVSLIVAVTANYLLSKYFVFHKAKEQ